MADIKVSISTSNSSVQAVVNPAGKVVPSRVNISPATNNPSFTGTLSHTGNGSISGALSVGSLTGNVTGDVTGNLTGTIQTAAQPNITSVGTLPSLNVGDLTVTGTTTGVSVSTGLANLSDTTITSIATGEILVYNGTAYVNQTLAEAGIAPLASPTFTGSITGTLGTASQPNITSVGTLTALVMGGTLNMGGQDITSAGNISGSTISGSTLDGSLSTAAQPNITSVGTLTSLISSGQLKLTGVSASSGLEIQNGFFNGGGIRIKHAASDSNEFVLAYEGNTDGGEGEKNFKLELKKGGSSLSIMKFKPGGDAFISTNHFGINKTSPTEALDVTGNIKASGDVQAQTMTVSGSMNADTIGGTIQNNAQPNITSVGTLTSLTASGDIESTGGSVISSHGNFTIVTGTIQTAAQTNITSLGTLANLTVSGYINASTTPVLGIHLANKTYVDAKFDGAIFTGTTTTNDLIVNGDLTLNGTTTTINSTTLTVDDKNIELGSTSSPTDGGADGGGITLKGDTDKTFNWINSTDSWTSSENIDLATGKVIKISGSDTLSATTLGSSVVNSSLTSLGTISTGVWNGTAISSSYIGNLPASKITSGTIADGRISASSITQHQAQINGVGTISTGVWQGTAIANDYIADIPTSKIQSGAWADSRISASSVTQHQGSLSIATSQLTGTFGDASISESSVTQHQAALAINATQITGGELSDARIPSTITRDSELSAHSGSTSNPHSVTKTQVGLGNVDNTSDANKPVSSATQTALDAKQDTLTFGINNTNPVKIDSADVSDDEYARFTSAGIEGRTTTEVKSDLSLNLVENKSSATIRSEIVDSDIPSTIARDSEVTASVSASVSYHTGLSNPHNITASKIGLGNVENKSSATIRSEITDSDIPSTVLTGFAGTSNITTVGTIGTGTWEGTAIANAYVADLPTSKIVGGTFDNARISSSSVLQYQSSITNVGTLDGVTTSGNLSVTGNATIGGDTTLTGNLTVNGTTTTINSTTLDVDDKNIELGGTSNPTDTSANEGGITLKGTTDKSIVWKNTSDSWTSSENLDLATGKTFKINSTDVLSNLTLGSGVVNSSLTSVGTLRTLTVASDGSSNGKVTCDALDADAFKVIGSGGGISYNTTAFTVDTIGAGTFANSVSAPTGTFTNVVSTNLTGTLQVAAQPNVTSVGTLTGLTLDGSISHTSGTLTLNGEKLTIGSGSTDAIKIDSTSTGTSNIFKVNAQTDTVSTAALEASSIKTSSCEPADFPSLSSSRVRTTTGFDENGTLVVNDKVIVKKVTGAQAQAMTTTESSFIEIIPAPGANKVIVVKEIELFIDRGSWSPLSGGQVRGWGDALTLVIRTPSNASGQKYNTYGTFHKNVLNHQFGNSFNASHAVDVLLVRDAPVTQTRAYPNVPLLLRPNSALAYTHLATYGQTVDDDYYFRIQYAIRDLTTDFAVTTT
jgi:hypothetical protein